MILKPLVLIACASLPLLAAFQSAKPENPVKVEAPGSATKLGSMTGPLTHDGKALKVGDAVRLFNGKDTTGWKAFVPDLAKEKKDQMSVWSVKDGVLQCAGRPIGYIQTEALYDNYELELDWRFDPAKGPGNSGVLLRVIGDDTVWPKSMEAQLHSRNAGDFWNIGEYKATVEKSRTEGRHTVKMHETNEKPLGEWNHYRIVVNGGTIELWVNGLLQNVATGVEANKGRIALQSEGAYIEFKDIVLRQIQN
jgi:hypothetical protein